MERGGARHINATAMTDAKLDLLQGTLDLMVLQTLHTLGPLHGYGIARRIEQMSGDEVILNQGTIYASLVRLQQRGWISAEWGTSDNNRRAKFYELTRQGKRHLAEQTSTFHLVMGLTKWGSLYISSSLLFFVLLFCTHTGFLGSAATAVVMAVLGTLLLRDKKTAAAH